MTNYEKFEKRVEEYELSAPSFFRNIMLYEIAAALYQILDVKGEERGNDK